MAFNLDKTSGSGNATLTITAGANGTTDEQRRTLTIRTAGGTERTVQLVQKGLDIPTEVELINGGMAYDLYEAIPSVTDYGTLDQSLATLQWQVGGFGLDMNSDTAFMYAGDSPWGNWAAMYLKSFPYEWVEQNWDPGTGIVEQVALDMSCTVEYSSPDISDSALDFPTFVPIMCMQAPENQAFCLGFTTEDRDKSELHLYLYVSGINEEGVWYNPVPRQQELLKGPITVTYPFKLNLTFHAEDTLEGVSASFTIGGISAGEPIEPVTWDNFGGTLPPTFSSVLEAPSYGYDLPLPGFYAYGIDMGESFIIQNPTLKISRL